MRKILLSLVVLVGCSDGKHLPFAEDKCEQVKLFHECLARVPAGPTSVQYNDWAEVVEACNAAAASHSAKRTENVKPECRGRGFVQ